MEYLRAVVWAGNVTPVEAREAVKKAKEAWQWEGQ